MDIRIHSAEINRMMKVIGKCLGPEGQGTSNIEIIYDNDRLAIRATNGYFFAVASAAAMGGDGERFCVDGRTFERIAGICNGDMTIRTEGKDCMIRGVGRTRIPIVEATIPPFERINGNSITVRGSAFRDCYKQVKHAICLEENRIQLTGVYMVSEENRMRMVALDGFQLSTEEIACTGDSMKAIVPGNFMELIFNAIQDTDDVRLTFSEKQIQVDAPGILMKCGLISGEYIDYTRIMPNDFKTRCRVRLQSLRNALRAGNAVNNKQRLIKMIVGEDRITIMNNSEKAEYEADIPCDMDGETMKIAFNEKYLMDTTASIDAEEIDIGFNGPLSPILIPLHEGSGKRLVLPVRTQG